MSCTCCFNHQHVSALHMQWVPTNRRRVYCSVAKKPGMCITNVNENICPFSFIISVTLVDRSLRLYVIFEIILCHDFHAKSRSSKLLLRLDETLASRSVIVIVSGLDQLEGWLNQKWATWMTKNSLSDRLYGKCNWEGTLIGTHGGYWMVLSLTYLESLIPKAKRLGMDETVIWCNFETIDWLSDASIPEPVELL